MKKRTVTAILAAVLAAALLLGGCSSKSSDYVMDSNGYVEEYYTGADTAPGEYGYADKDMMESTSVTTDSAGNTIMEVAAERKIIMTANYTIETKEYDDSYSALLGLTERLGGYVSASDYRGISLDSYGSRSRYCTVTVRIPAENYREFTDTLQDVGNVSYSYESTNDVTTQYYDLQARIDSLQVQEKRLLELLEKAETVEEILQIESQLSEVRYQIESYQTNFKVLSDSVSYSTVTIDLQEVIEYSKEPVRELTFGEKIVRRLSDGWEAFLSFCEGFVLVLLVCLPFLVVIAVIVVVIVLLCKRSKKRRAKRLAELAKAAQEQQAAQAKAAQEQNAQEQNAREQKTENADSEQK